MGTALEGQFEVQLGCFGAALLPTTERLKQALSLGHGLREMLVSNLDGPVKHCVWSLMRVVQSCALDFDTSIVSPEFCTPLADILSNDLLNTLGLVVGCTIPESVHPQPVLKPQSG